MLQVEASESISSVREKVAKQFSIESFKMLHHGRLLSDGTQLLTFYKMAPTSTIHVIEHVVSPDEDAAAKKPAPTDDELQQFMIAFGLTLIWSAFSCFLLSLASFAS